MYIIYYIINQFSTITTKDHCTSTNEVTPSNCSIPQTLRIHRAYTYLTTTASKIFSYQYITEMYEV